MNAKKKNKNKPKPQKLPPKQETTATPKNPDVDAEILQVDKPDACVNVEIVSEETNIVPEVVSDFVPVTDTELPKRPKRAKGKKKENITDADKPIEDKSEHEIGAKDSVETGISENVIPRSRKKKKGKKISDEQAVTGDSIVGETVEVVKVDDIPDDTQKKDNDQPLEPEPSSSKKKKKKKNRNDSEKSDKNEGIPCTLAFKKLLESQDQDVLTQVDDDKQTEISIESKESNKESLSENIEKSSLLDVKKDDENKTDEFPTNIKRNKKNKKDKQSKVDVKKETEKEISKTELMKESELLLTITDETEQISITNEKEKIKAKIVKPVEKRCKNKSEFQPVKLTDAEDIDESVEIKSDESAKTSSRSESKNKSKIQSHVIEDILPAHPTQVENIEKNVEMQTDENSKICSKSESNIDIKHETNIHEETSVGKEDSSVIETKAFDVQLTKTEHIKTEYLQDSSVIKIQQLEPEHKIDITEGFVETKTQRKKKKRHGKPEITSEISENTVPIISQIKDNEIISSVTECAENKALSDEKSLDTTPRDTDNSVSPHQSEQELSMHIPDLIQCPMSSSQQLLDSNNNTIIQEISTPEEIKLEIPLYIGEPIIRGSGESPEVYSDTQPDLSLKATEVESKSNTNSQEKTDLKSKMMEVNQDMEELRLSIERSLAELTAIEKSEETIEKQFIDKSMTEEKDLITSPELQQSMNIETLIENQPVEKDNNISDIAVKASEPVINKLEQQDKISEIPNKTEISEMPQEQPICPTRKDNKGKNKSKKKGKQDVTPHSTSTISSSTQPMNESASSTSNTAQESNKTEKTGTSNSSKDKGKQQSLNPADGEKIDTIEDNISPVPSDLSFDPIEHFEDALTSSVDDVNQTFEMIVNEIKTEQIQHHDNPQINIIAPAEDEPQNRKEKQNPVTKPKNLLGHPDIPVPSNKTDYKKEKNKLPNYRHATVKIKDSVEIEKSEKQSKESQTKLYGKDFLKNPKNTESFSYMTNENNEFIYKYSFRKVFLQSTCHVCKKDLTSRFPCKFCSLIFYCSQKHMSEDWPRHQSLCFAVSTIAHLKGKKQSILDYHYK